MPDIDAQLAFLADNSRRFDDAVRLQAAVWEGSAPERQPLLLACDPSPGFDAAWPAGNFLEIHYDSEKMFTSGLRGAVLAAKGGAEAVPSVRANMGCGIIPTMFGVKQLLFEDKMPWVKEHLSKGQLREMQPGDLVFGEEMRAAFAHMDYMAGRLLGTGCRVYPIDQQGAFDTAHLVYGDAIFLDLYDDPDFVHHLLDLSCHAIETAMDACLKRIPGSSETVAHYNCLAMPRSRGGVKFSEDTSTLLSGAQIAEFVTPCLERLLRHFNGGYVHYCGVNPHLYAAVMRQELAFGLNFGNPEKHDMEAVLRDCARLGKVYYGSIPKVGAESPESYFKRCLGASAGANGSRLLLAYSCGEAELTETQDAWSRAQYNLFESPAGR